MTTEDLRQELERDPFVPLRLHLSSGKKVDVTFAGAAWLRQNALLIVHPIGPGTVRIGSYDMIAPRLIERIERIDTSQRQAG